MQNFHQESKLISKEEIHKIESILEDIWSQDTTDPENRASWTKENKALGQCAITSLVIYDMFGGRMIYDKVNFHIWNELPDGSQHDFSRTQFKDNTIFSIYKYKTKDDILYDERGLKFKIIDRYQDLSVKFNQRYIIKI